VSKTEKSLNVLVTGAAGFIGAALCKRLLEAGHSVVGIDNLNDYYDVSLKEDRLETFRKMSNFRFEKLDIANRAGLEALFATVKFDRVAHLAAQAGVRYSTLNPHAYADSNLIGFLNILEGCRHHAVQHLIYASTSSVYGLNTEMPFSEHQGTNHPVSFYAATKKANEMMAHSYSHLYGLPTTGLRFFTVYGPWGRPDMAPFQFAKNILAGKPIDVFNHGKHLRDFTYIDDIVEGVARTVEASPPLANAKWDTKKPDPATSAAPYRIYNIGNSQPVELMRFIELLEENFGKKAQKNFLPMQPGDVHATYADMGELERAVGYRPTTTIEDGTASFARWYLDYYKVNA
jgi:UDP-glucuronate 4-epimerase